VQTVEGVKYFANCERVGSVETVEGVGDDSYISFQIK
jgi:hypothetical protein